MGIPNLSFILAIAAILSTNALNDVEFYTESFLRGDSITLTMDDVNCQNLPSNFQNRVSSKNAVGNARCGYVYELNNCQGRKVRMERYSWKSLDFANAGIDKNVHSYRNCNPDGKQRIYINDAPNYGGKSWYLDLPSDGSCVTLGPPHDTITDSVVVYDYCVIAWDRPFCNGAPIRLDATTLGVRDLELYKFDRRPKSFQLCYGVDTDFYDVEHTK